MHVNLAKARHFMEGMAHIAPDRKAQCYNVRPDDAGTQRPECIVGAWLYLLGIHPDTLADCGGVNSASFTAAIDGVLTLDKDARRYLLAVQSLQDSGETWNDAVSQANAEVFGE